MKGVSKPVSIYKLGKLFCSFTSAREYSEYAGIKYETALSRIGRASNIDGYVAKYSDIDSHPIAVFFEGNREHTAYSVNQAKDQTGISGKKIISLLESGEEFKGYSFDEAYPNEEPEFIYRNCIKYTKTERGYRAHYENKFLHREIYKQEHILPKGRRIIFRDGNNLNVDIDNMRLA